MAVTTAVANSFKALLGTGGVDFTSDAFRIILMDDTFVFDPDSHSTYSDVSASELADGYGYTQGAKELVVDSAWAADNATDIAGIQWDAVGWTASGGAIGPSAGAVIIQYDSVTPADSPVLGGIDFGQTVSATDGNPFAIFAGDPDYGPGLDLE